MLGALLLACAAAATRPAGSGAVEILRAADPSADEAYCAWFGDAADGVLYFGQAAFWSAYRAAGGDPRADLERAGPQAIGRFDLGSRRFLDPLPTGDAHARTGTWDVLVHPNGRIYFTTLFETAGFVEPATGRVERFGAASRGLNELWLAPDGRVLATRYSVPGSIVVLDPDGRIEREHPLTTRPPWAAAAKSLALDPVREEIWVNTDLLGPNGAVRHDARVLELSSGRELERFERPELQFVAFDRDGTGYTAWADGERLTLRTSPPGERPGPGAGRGLVLDLEFASDHDFVQDLRPDGAGGVVVTRWSGRVHRVEADGSLHDMTLPRPNPDALYYTAVLHDGHLCATCCAGITVVCKPLP